MLDTLLKMLTMPSDNEPKICCATINRASTSAIATPMIAARVVRDMLPPTEKRQKAELLVEAADWYAGDNAKA